MRYGRQADPFPFVANFYRPKNESPYTFELSGVSMTQVLDTNIFKYILPLYFPFIFAYSLSQLVIFIVSEKSQKLREHMRMAGVRDSVYWTSWLVTQLSFVIVSILLFEGLLYAVGIFKYTSARTPGWLFLIGFLTASILQILF